MLLDFYNWSDAQIRRWLWLRAIEWSGWPAFVSQLFVAPFLIYFTWYQIWIGILVADLIWQCLIHVFVSPRLATISCILVVWLKWPITIGCVVYLFVHSRYGAGLLALFWPLLCGWVTIPSSTLLQAVNFRLGIGEIELEFAKRIGYVPQDAQL